MPSFLGSVAVLGREYPYCWPFLFHPQEQARRDALKQRAEQSICEEPGWEEEEGKVSRCVRQAKGLFVGHSGGLERPREWVGNGHSVCSEHR